MPTSPDKPRYVPPEEAAKDGFYPDQEPSDFIEVYDAFPFVHIGNQFEKKAGTIRADGETLELPKQVRRKAEKVGLGLDGELHARPATNSERGGGIQITHKKHKAKRTHHAASYIEKIHFPKD